MENRADIYLADSRTMPEVPAGAVDLVITSPPYWQIKDYGIPGQIGYGQSLHEYLRDLFSTWGECFRVLRPGGRLCINIGDQFARARVFGRYKIIPLHAEIILQGEHLGFDFLGAVIWQKKTTMNPSGGAVVMGSYPFPPNGLVEIDYEFILIFKKPGAGKKAPAGVKEAARLSKEEWKEYFAGHWHFGGTKQTGHEAMFPAELPRRLIRMFTFPGDTVLDPFLGSGTTVQVALDLGRNGVGYEINEDFRSLMEEKLYLKNSPPGRRVKISKPRRDRGEPRRPAYTPALPDMRPPAAAAGTEFSPPLTRKVVRIVSADAIVLEDGQEVRFLGVTTARPQESREYLQKHLLGREVIVKGDARVGGDTAVWGYVYLKNRIFINAYLIKAGLGAPDANAEHRHKRKFAALWRARQVDAAVAESDEGRRPEDGRLT